MLEDAGLRERKKAQTEQALLAAAHTLFMRQGFDETRVEEIAALANVSRRTFFRYFPSKEAVMFPENAARFERFRALMEERRAGESGFDSVRRACHALAVDYMEHRQALLEQWEIVQTSSILLAQELKLDRVWESAIAQALGESEEETEEEKRKNRLLAGAIMGMIRAALREWFETRCETDLWEPGQEAFALLEAGMAPRRRQKQ